MSATMDWIKKMDNIATSKGMNKMYEPQTVANNHIMGKAQEWQTEQDAENERLEQDALVETLYNIAMLVGPEDEF